MWSPKANANGARNQFYENMRQVAPGDIVFSFRDTRIQAVGVVTAVAQTAPKPDFGNVGLNWANEGWFGRRTTFRFSATSFQPGTHPSRRTATGCSPCISRRCQSQWPTP